MGQIDTRKMNSDIYIESKSQILGVFHDLKMNNEDMCGKKRTHGYPLVTQT